MSLILALALSVSDEAPMHSQMRLQLALEATGEFSLSPATARGVQVDGIFGPSLSLSIPIRDAYWLTFMLGGRAGTLGGRSTGATQTVSVSSRDGVLDLRVLAHVPVRLRRHVELRIGPLAGVAVQIARTQVLVGSRSDRVSAFVGLEAGARAALFWHRAVFSLDVYGFFNPAALPSRFVVSAGVGATLF